MAPPGSAAAAVVRASLLLLLALSLLALLAAPAAMAGSGQLVWSPAGVAAFSGLSWVTGACADGAGGVIVVSSVYAEGTGFNLFAQRVDANGTKPWGDTPKVVCNAVDDQEQFVCTSDGAGGVIVAWTDLRRRGRGDSSLSEIYAQRLDADGVVLWAANGVLIDGAADFWGGNTDPQVLADGTGGAIITWLHGRVAPVGVRAQRLSAAGAAQWVAGGVRVADNTDDPEITDPYEPTITWPGPLAGDGAGGAMVTFVRSPLDNSTGNPHPWMRVYVVRVEDDGAVAGAPTAVADVVSPLANYQYFQKIVYDGAGNAIVAWVDMRHKEEVDNPTAYETDLYAQKVRVSDGARLWAAAGQPLCTAVGYQDELRLMLGVDNSAVAVWADHAYDMPSGPYQFPFICANRIDASGATQWGLASGGVRVMDAAGAFYEGLGACSDGAGGVYVAWPDLRNSVIKYSTGETFYTEEVVYGQHIGADGALKWGTNKEGEALWYGPHDITYSSAPNVTCTSDGALGAVWQAATTDGATETQSVLTQKVTDNSAEIVPHLDSVSPTTVGPKGTITLRGIHLGPFVNDSTTKVLVNGVWADRQQWHDAWVQAILPAGLEGVVNVTVQTPRGTSNAMQVTVTRPAPVLYGCTPGTGPVGTVTDLRGDYFGLTQAGSSGSVEFQNATTSAWVPATVTSWSYRHIFVTVPAGLPTGWAWVRVITDKGTTPVTSRFNVTAGTPAPSITTLNPTSGAIGSPVQINGANFGATKGTSTVKFGTTVAATTAWSDTQITATVPAGLSPGSVNVTVTTAGGTSGAAAYTVTVPPPVPTITDLSSASGYIGDEISIYGSNFGDDKGASYVQIGSTGTGWTQPATYTAWGAEVIQFVVPSGPVGPLQVRVVTPAGMSNAVAFTFGGERPPVPVLTSLSSASGVPGATVTLTGSGFGATKGTSTVKFGTLTATTTAWSATAITCKVPAGASGTVNVTVRTGGGTSAARPFKVKPKITGLSPLRGRVGATVAINGAGFSARRGTSVVKFGTKAVATYVSWSNTKIRVKVPRMSKGSKTVTVTVGGLKSNGKTFKII